MSNEDILEKFRKRRLLTQSEAHFCYTRSQIENVDIVDVMLDQGFAAAESASELRRLCQSEIEDISAGSSLYSVALPRIGDVVDNFEILEILGEGGMGAVYKARGYLQGQRALNLPPGDYAMKVMNTHTDHALDRFEREAQALAAVDLHPNIIRIHAFSKHGRRPYLVLDWVEGESLEDRLVEGNYWSEKECLEKLIKIADALEFIHEHGILHRDLKPGNVLIRESDGEVFLSDFGLAKVLHKETLTSTEEVLGTPVYMAPEQLCGDEELGPEADIWSLGVILYELSTGRLPFDSENSVELAELIIREDPQLPSALNPEISPAMEAVIWKCLAKDPEDRYLSAEDLREEFQSIQKNRPVSARLPGKLRRRLSLFSRRHGRSSVYVLIGIILLLSASVVVLVTRAGQRYQLEEKQREVAAAFVPVKKQLQRKTDTLVSHAAVHFLDCVPFEGRLPSGPCKECDTLTPLQSNWRDYVDLRQELIANSRESSLPSIVPKRKHREYAQIIGLFEDFQRVKKNEALSKSLSADNSSVYHLRAAFRALHRGQSLSAQSHLGMIDGSLEAIVPLGLALVATQLKQWEKAIAALKRFAKEHPQTPRYSQFLQAVYEEQFLRWIRVGPMSDWSKQKNYLKGQSRGDDDDWLRLNSRISTLFIGENRTLASLAGRYRRLQLSQKSYGSLELPSIDADFHFALGLAARDENMRNEAQFHFLSAQLKGCTKETPAGFRQADFQRELAQHLSSEELEGMVAAFKLLIASSRAGLYTFVAREIWLLALHERGVMAKALTQSPGDPWIIFWRGMREISDPSKNIGDMNAAKKDMTTVINDTRVQDSFRAVAYLRRAKLNIWLSSARGQGKLFKEGVRDLERAVKRGHPACDQVYKFWASLEDNPERRLELELKRYEALENRRLVHSRANRNKSSLLIVVKPLLDQDYRSELMEIMRVVIRKLRALDRQEEARRFFEKQRDKLPRSDYTLLQDKLFGKSKS